MIRKERGLPRPATAQGGGPAPGREALFDRLVEEYTPRLFRTVRRFTSDAGEAEALVQETWLRAWKAFSQVDA